MKNTEHLVQATNLPVPELGMQEDGFRMSMLMVRELCGRSSTLQQTGQQTGKGAHGPPCSALEMKIPMKSCD